MPDPRQASLMWQTAVPTAGVDEAGRGPLAGPVVAAAVILGSYLPEGLADSKALSGSKRERLFEQITARAESWAIAQASVEEIDRLNILGATLLAMQRAVLGLKVVPRHVMVDGNQLPRLPMSCEAIVRGDAKVPAISAASVLAKVFRDRLCEDMHRDCPEFGFGVHKGYPTQGHLRVLQALGPTRWHRQSFAPVRAALARAEQEAP